MLKFGFVTLIVSLLITKITLAADDCDFERIKYAQAVAHCKQQNDSYANNCPTTTTLAWGSAFGVWTTDIYNPLYERLWCYPVACDGFVAVLYKSTVNDLWVKKSCMPTEEEEVFAVSKPVIQSIQNLDAQCRQGSVIETSNQVVGESIPLVGVPFYLTHFSSRVEGRIGDYYTKFALTEGTYPSRISNFVIRVEDANNNLISSEQLAATSNLHYIYQWDGKTSGVENWASVKRNLIIKTNTTSGTAIADHTFPLSFGSLKAKKLGLGGWLPSIWKFYDATSDRLYNGEGSSRVAQAVVDGAYNRVASTDGSEVYYFDSIGRIAFTKTGLTGGLIYSFQYRSDEKLASITDAFNKVTKFNYDSTGKILEIVSSENIKTKLSVGNLGYLSSVTNPKSEVYSMAYKNSGGLLATFTKPTGNVTTFSYDVDGNLLLDSNSAGFSSTLSKASSGVNAVSAMGRLTQNNYNQTENTEIEIRPSGLSTTFKFTAAEDSVTLPYANTKTSYENDPRFGNQVKSVLKVENNNFGATVTNVENEVNLNDLTNPFAIQSLSKTITQGDSQFISAYDGLTRTTTLTSKLGRSIATQLDSLERPILEKVGTLVATKYKYDQDRITEVAQGDRKYNFTYNTQTKLLQSVKNSENETVSFGYDEAQRLKSKTLPDGRVINYIYDSNGNLTSLTPPSRPAHKQVYGANEKLASYNPPALTGVANVNTTYAYNLDKQLTKIARPDGAEINYNYNLATGLLDSIVGAFGTLSNLYSNERLIKITDNTGRTMNFAYTGNVVSAMSLRNASSKTEYAYQRTPLANSNGLIKSETLFVGTKTQTINYGFDDDKFLVKAGDLDLAYNTPNGNLKETALQNVKEEYTYNTYGEIAGYKAYYLEGSEKKLLYSYDLKRDKVGRIIKKSESFGKDEEKRHKHHHHRHYCRHHNHDDKIDTEYDYDKVGRLTRVKAEKRADSIYLYDHNSNRIAGVATGEPFLAVYDNQDRLIRYNNQTYTYNANGDLLSKAEKVKKAYVTTNYNYDVFGSLKLAGNVTYKTDHLQRRALKLVNNVVVKQYAYSPEGKLIGEMDGDGNLLKTFIYGSKAHVPDYFIDQNNELFKLVLDHLGSVRLIVKATTGEIVEKMNHDEFGKVLEDSNPGLVPFGFAGGIYDSETGLVRMGARDYDSETGRWTSKDPIRFSAGDPNLYGYVLQDPVNFVDPNGTDGVPVAGIGDFLRQVKDAFKFKKRLQDLQDRLLCKLNPKLCEDGRKPDQNPLPPEDPNDDEEAKNQCTIGDR